MILMWMGRWGWVEQGKYSECQFGFGLISIELRPIFTPITKSFYKALSMVNRIMYLLDYSSWKVVSTKKDRERRGRKDEDKFHLGECKFVIV